MRQRLARIGGVLFIIAGFWFLGVGMSYVTGGKSVRPAGATALVAVFIGPALMYGGVRLWQWTQDAKDTGVSRSTATSINDQLAANWYPDPSGDHHLRFWDGAVWTNRVRHSDEKKPLPPWLDRPQDHNAANPPPTTQPPRV